MKFCTITAAAMLVAALAGAAPPLSIEITAEHPLLLFAAPGREAPDAVSQAGAIADAWTALPDSLRPYSVLVVANPWTDVERRHAQFYDVLTELQEASVPVAIEIADRDPRRMYPPKALEELLKSFTGIRGVRVSGLAFNQYPPYGDDPAGTPVEAQWLSTIIDIAASYGRFVTLALDELHWLRIMTNPVYQPLYDSIREHRAYVIPLNLHRGPQTIARTSALMGSWIEGRVDRWGLALDSAWYSDANFITPGVFGGTEGGARMPPELYRAMVLNGAMTGAQAYAFDEPVDLWTGARRYYWDQSIRSSLEEIIGGGLIARKDIVQDKVKVAYQLWIAETPARFRENVDDVDVIYGKGNLLRAAYGVENAGQVPELIPNSGRNYWIPILSPWAPQEVLDGLDAVVGPGDISDLDAWGQLLEQRYAGDGDGDAFIARAGRACFVLHTHENLYAEQTFRLPSVPIPVRGLKMERSPEGVLLTWPFREGDFSYTVYRRILPGTNFEIVAPSLDSRRYLDAAASPDDTVAYAVSALTNDREPFEGKVNFGDYLVFSAVESRLEEEVVVYPLTESAAASLIREPTGSRPASQSWWPNVDGLTVTERARAEAIAFRIETLEEAFERESLDDVMDAYAERYRDIDGAGRAYATQVFEAFFSRYDGCRMHRQVRRWDFSTYDATGEVSVLLYCRFAGVALTDRTGRFADIPESFPDHASGEVWVTFSEEEGPWRIVHTNPALPRLGDIVGAP